MWGTDYAQKPACWIEQGLKPNETETNTIYHKEVNKGFLDFMSNRRGSNHFHILQFDENDEYQTDVIVSAAQRG